MADRPWSIEKWIKECIATARKRGDLVLDFRETLPAGPLKPDAADEAFAIVAQAFRDCRGIRAYCCRWFNDQWVSALAAHVQHFSQLQILIMFATQVSDAGLRALAAQAQHLSQLQVLAVGMTPWLNENWEGDMGVLAAHALHLSQLRRPFFPNQERSLAVRFEEAKFCMYLEILGLDGTVGTVGDVGLKALADQAHYFRQLRALDLGATKVGDEGLEALAAARFPNLRYLNISNTCITLPDAIDNSFNAQALLQYVRERLEVDAQPLSEIKLLIVGQAETGKTHLVKRVFQGTRNPRYYDAAEDRTHDVGRYEFSLAWPPKLAKGPSELKVRVWDFGGQNELHSTHQFFLGGQRCFYLLALRADRPADGEGPEANRLSYWLRLIAHYGRAARGKRAPVVIAVTQCDRKDLDPEEKNTFDDMMQALALAKEKNWYGANVVGDPIIGLGWSDDVENRLPKECREIAERNRKACDRLRKAIEHNAARVPDIASNYPAKFFAVMEFVEDAFGSSEIEGDGRDVPYFDYRGSRNAFQKLCKQKEINLGSVELYLRNLKSLGLVHWVGDIEEICRGTDADLKHRVFNPEWLREPVYKIIGLDENRAGIVTWGTLERCRGRCRLGDRDWNNILGLMKACRLVYHAKRAHGLLIPDLLAAVNLEESERLKAPFNTSQAETWRLEAEFLPEKVFLRLLAENYDLIVRPNKECYRNEVQLEILIQGEKVPVLVCPILSPENGQRPYLEVIAVNDNKHLRWQAVVRVDQKIEDIFKNEDLCGWIGAKTWEELNLDEMRLQHRADPASELLPQPADGTILTDRVGHVTLNQMAAIVNRSKRTLERFKTRRTNPLPNPDVEGGGGRPDEWLWSRVRPWLEQEFSKHLPERHPAHRH